MSYSRGWRQFTLAAGLALSLGATAAAQTGSMQTASTNTRTVASGQKMKVKGVVTRRDIDANTFDVLDANGVTTTVALDDRTSVKSKGGFFGGGSTYGAANILRGLNLEVEGRGDAQGRLAEAEQNAQRLSGQLEELAAVSNAARGGAKAAQETADMAVSGVNMTNERISALDDYTVQQSVNVNFRVGSAVLSPEAKRTLDDIAQQALRARGYVVEVRGFASADGSENANRQLSQRRADAVVRYLAETHNIPLRRIITPFGYGEKQAIADNTTREGRQQNRRVEVAVLVNRGLTQQGPNLSPTKQEAAAPP